MGTHGTSRVVRIQRSVALGIVWLAALSLATVATAAQVTLRVIEAEGGAPVGTYKYLINVDNTGTTTQRSPADGCNPGASGYPGSCKWTSIAGVPGSSPIYTQGDQSSFATATPLVLPPGRYLLSVLADGHKLDGKHFTVGSTNMQVTVELHVFPLPPATIQAAVFEDISPVNGAPDLPAEHGLAGFQGHIADYLGEVTTDVFGSPLCSAYDSAGEPIPGSGGKCLSKCYVVSGGNDIGTVAPIDAAGRCPVTASGSTLEGTPIPAGATVEGKVKIPNVGPNRYALSVTPPDGSDWVQTTTLEGNHDWDAWVMEGATGLDTEFVIAGEPFPAIIFGYVPGSPRTFATPGSGSITGVVDGVKVYVPTVGGVGGLPGDTLGCCVGAKLDKPIVKPWITLSDLGNGDTMVWVGQGDDNGRFTIPNVPAGTYSLTWWDEKQNYILDLVNVTVGAGESVDMGILPLAGWWTYLEGYVFNDTNRNGVKDPGEPGLAGYTLTMRKRENSLMDRGATVVTTDASGHYVMENAYPMTQWLVMEAYDDLHYTTGVTFQADNQPTPTTHLGAGVDVSVLPIIGLGGRLDWGKHTYDPTGSSCSPVGSYENCAIPRNGGIVGTVSYDTTRNELDPLFAAAEDWQPGISNLTVKLFSTVACGTNPGAPCDASHRYELDTDGGYKRGSLLNTYVTEAWQRPTGCIARNVDGNPLAHGSDEQVLPLADDAECLEGPLMGVQFGTYAADQGTPDANFGASVDGNYGFGDGCFVSTVPFVPGQFNAGTGACDAGDFATLPGGRDYLVEVEIPNDATGRPTYKVTREEDINIGNGDDFFPPAVPPPSCAGPLHIVDVAGSGTDGYASVTLPNGVVVPASTPTDNATFVDIGGSPYEGQARPLCNVKLVNLSNGKSIVPVFNLFTDVPLPTRFWGLLVDDLNFSVDPKSLLFGEKAGVPFAPVGIYDWTNKLDHDRRVGLQRTVRRAAAVEQPDQLPDAVRRVREPVPVRRQRPGRSRSAQPELQPAVPHDRGRVRSDPGIDRTGGPRADAGRHQRPAAGWAGDAADRVQARRRDAPALRRQQAVPAIVGERARDRRHRLRLGARHGDARRRRTDDQFVEQYAHRRACAVVAVVGVQQSARWPTARDHRRERTAHDQRPDHPRARRLVRPARVRGRTGQAVPAAGNAAGVRRSRDPARARRIPALRAGRRVSEHQHSRQPAAESARRVLREPDPHSRDVKLQGVGPGSFQTASVPGSIIDGGAFGGDSPVADDWYTLIGAPDLAGNQTIYDGAVISIYRATGNNAELPEQPPAEDRRL